MFYCPHCGKEIYDDSMVCPGCGGNLPIENQEQPVNNTYSNNVNTYDSYNNSSNSYSGYDSYNNNNDTYNSDPYGPYNPSANKTPNVIVQDGPKGKLIGIVLGSIVALIVAMIICVSIMSSNKVSGTYYCTYNVEGTDMTYVLEMDDGECKLYFEEYDMLYWDGTYSQTGESVVIKLPGLLTDPNERLFGTYDKDSDVLTLEDPDNSVDDMVFKKR